MSIVLHKSQHFSEQIKGSLNEGIPSQDLKKDGSLKVEKLLFGTVSIELLKHVSNEGNSVVFLVEFGREIKGHKNDDCLLGHIDVDQAENLIDDFDRPIEGLGLMAHLDVDLFNPVENLLSALEIVRGERGRLWEVLIAMDFFEGE